MSLILAIEPDQRQAAQLADLIRGRLNADLVHARTTEGALTALAGIGDRVPDLVLVPSLLSAQEDAAIAGALRLIAAAANVQMLTIPRLEAPEQPAQARGVFAKLRGRKTKKGPNGCDPAVFADQIASYLAEAAAARRAQQADDELLALPDIATEVPAATAAPTLASVTSAPDEFSPDPVLDLLAATVLASTEDPIGEPLLATPAVDAARESVVAPIITPSREPISTPISESIPESVVEPVSVADAPQPAAITEVYAPLVLGRPPGLSPVDETQPLIRAAAAEPIVEPPRREIANAPEPIVEPPGREIANAPDLIVPEAPAAMAPESGDVFAEREETPIAADVVPATPVAARRRRKAVRPPAPKPENTFDIDALLAPLLSELAAKRTMPPKRDKPRPVSAAIDVAPPAAAVSTPEPSVIAPRPAARVLPPSPPAVQEEPASVEPAASIEPAASRRARSGAGARGVHGARARHGHGAAGVHRDRGASGATCGLGAGHGPDVLRGGSPRGDFGTAVARSAGLGRAD
jgi:hypothetical protein